MRDDQKREVRGFRVTSMEYSEQVLYDRHEVELRVVLTVLHRETGEPGPVTLRESIDLRAWERMDAHGRADYAHHVCQRALLHELDECFYVGRVRVYDPHRDEGTDANGAPV